MIIFFCFFLFFFFACLLWYFFIPLLSFLLQISDCYGFILYIYITGRTTPVILLSSCFLEFSITMAIEYHVIIVTNDLCITDSVIIACC